MAGYIIRRLIWTPILLLIVSYITFALVQFAPGDPVLLKLDQHANPEAVERIRTEMGLNDPVTVQYVRYIARAVRGDFGESI